MEAAVRVLILLVMAGGLTASCASPPTKPAASNPAPAAVGADQTGSPQSTPPSPGEFVATEELYRTTFREVQDVCAAITAVIAAGDFEAWLSYLTQGYVTATSSPEFLAEASNAPVLKNNRIVLRSLRDYFENVVVRSRMQATLDDIQFVDETHVKAIALVKDRPVILYYLVREDGRWKVGLLPAGGS